ncbi:MAG: hypothetical protein WEB33_08900 [Bacteroidota bacterium]
MKRVIFTWVLFSAAVQGQELPVEIPSAEEKKLEWSGNFDAKYAFFYMAQGSPMYRLQLSTAGLSSEYLSQYRIEPYINADYQTRELGFHLKTHATYYSDDDARVDLFEAYGSYSPSFNSSVQAGKRIYNWGKGYAFNPVGYVNPVKDPENPELAQAGLLSANIEYIKSLSSPALQSFAILLAVIPQAPGFGTRYAEAENIDVALKTYFLIWDTDIDLMGYYSARNARHIGLDVSRNVTDNFELHGELSYNQHVQRYSVSNGGLRIEERNDFSSLLGLRYLHESNTTIIAEYYHNSLGLNKREFEEYLDLLTSGANSGNAMIAQQTLGLNQRYFRSSTLMRDYLYVKIILPEPFEWLYFTPSFYAIYNLNDNSSLFSMSLSYKPVNNVEFIFWPTLLAGGDNTEFGAKMVRQKIELWARVFF